MSSDAEKPGSQSQSSSTTGAGPLENFREKKLDVTLALQDLSDVASALGAKTLHARISESLVRKLEEDRFHLVVVGEFNHGKTTFVNGLLGAHVLPTGVTPTTATIHHLRYGETPQARVIFTGGGEKEVAFESVRDFVVGGESATEGVDRLEVDYPANLLKERIVLVDTPGVNDLSLQRADITYSYIPQSDAVLFLLDAGQILKESERAFLQDKVIGQARDKIVFVVTKWDLLSASEQEEALAYAKTNLAKFVKGEPVVYPVSAQRALAGDNETSGMPALIEFLTRFLAEQRGRILLDNALGEGLAATNTLSKGVDAKRRALSMDDAELGRRISMIEADLAGQGVTIEQRRSKIREEVGAVKAWARRDLDRFVDDATRMVIPQIEEAKAGDLKTYFQSYIEQIVRQWAEAETKEIATALEAIAERTIALVREDAHESAKRLGDQLGTTMPGLKVEVDSLAFDIGVAGLATVGIASIFSGAVMFGAVMLFAAPVVAMVARDRINAQYKKQAKEKTPEILREVANKLGPKLEALIDDFADRLDAWVVAAGEELHREMLEVLQSVKAARAVGVEKSASERAETEVQAAKLAKTKARLEALRTGLWGEAVAEDAAEIGDAGPNGRVGIGGAPPVNSQGGAA